jgi:hypothetical protein
LLNDAAKRERLGRDARARALEHFTEEQFLSSYQKTYHELLSSRPQKLMRA